MAFPCADFARGPHSDWAGYRVPYFSERCREAAMVSPGRFRQADVTRAIKGAGGG